MNQNKWCVTDKVKEKKNQFRRKIYNETEKQTTTTHETELCFFNYCNKNEIYEYMNHNKWCVTESKTEKKSIY